MNPLSLPAGPGRGEIVAVLRIVLPSWRTQIVVTHLSLLLTL